MFYTMKNISKKKTGRLLRVGRYAVLPLLLAAWLLASCGGCSHQGDGTRTGGDSLTIVVDTTGLSPTENDSTVYGRADGFGQSGLTLVKADGQTVELSLTAEHFERADEQYAEIYGDREDTARYALTLCDGGNAVRRMINVSQLQRFLTDYTIRNAQLYLTDANGRLAPVVIEQLDDHVLMTRDTTGNIQRWKR